MPPICSLEERRDDVEDSDSMVVVGIISEEK